jgi:hypothetical protein
MLDRLRGALSFPLVHVWHPGRGFQEMQDHEQGNRGLVGILFDFYGWRLHPQERFRGGPSALSSAGILSFRRLLQAFDGSEPPYRPRIDLEWSGFSPGFLRSAGLGTRLFPKFAARGSMAALLNGLTPTRASWNGHNASAFRKDLLAVNGFDERMVYGGEDRECGERLVNMGLRGRGVRYLAVCIHLDHPRGYVTREGIAFNHNIRKATRKLRRQRTSHGINRDAHETMPDFPVWPFHGLTRKPIPCNAEKAAWNRQPFFQKDQEGTIRQASLPRRTFSPRIRRKSRSQRQDPHGERCGCPRYARGQHLPSCRIRRKAHTRCRRVRPLQT